MIGAALVVGAPAASAQTEARTPTSIEELIAATAVEAPAAAPAAQAPATIIPLPTQNPLRGLRSARYAGEFQATGFAAASAVALPAPDRVIPAPAESDTTVDGGGGASGQLRALAPLLNYDISGRDIELLRESLDHALRNRDSEAEASRAAIANPVARKLASWLHLRKNEAHPEPLRLARFRAQNPDWPAGALLQRNGEQALWQQNADPASVLAFYKDHSPATGLGRFLLARARKHTGEAQAAASLARDSWRRDTFSSDIESRFLAEFGDVLTPGDHLLRANHFLYKDNRQLLPHVQRIVKFLGAGDRAKIALRMDVVNRRLSAAEKEFARLGPAALSDPGLLMSRIQMLRRKKHHREAFALFARAPQKAAEMHTPAAWWTERRIAVRLALSESQPAIAYDIAARHGEISGEDLIDAEFLAGWIALSRLGKPAVAERHFAAMQKAAGADDAQHQAKASFWLGRARQAQKDEAGAHAHYTAAARFQHDYYGQLALHRLPGAGLRIAERPAAPTNEDIERFKARDAVQALVIAHKARVDGVPRAFFSHLAWRLKSPGEMILLAELAEQMQSRNASVITGKIGVYRGFPLDRYAYPLDALPAYDRLTADVEKPLLLALARQESEFNAEAHSPAGARGMMQIMPGTAKLIARAHGVAYNRDRLVSDPSYNVTLGVAHIHDLIRQYNGSYILTLVAYNAGPGRVRQWIEAFGDPRSGDVDAVDWVESVPFAETRRYIQRILASAQVFRHRQRGGKGSIRLVQDLKRGTPGDVRKASFDGGPASAPVVD